MNNNILLYMHIFYGCILWCIMVIMVYYGVYGCILCVFGTYFMFKNYLKSSNQLIKRHTPFKNQQWTLVWFKNCNLQQWKCAIWNLDQMKTPTLLNSNVMQVTLRHLIKVSEISKAVLFDKGLKLQKSLVSPSVTRMHCAILIIQAVSLILTD